MMQIFLGDRITIVKGETWITGQISGVTLDDRGDLERIKFQHIDTQFWMSAGWKFVDEESVEWETDEEEQDNG